MKKHSDVVLAHYGVKGMKWGVRKDAGHEGERVKTKKLAKLDKKYEKSFEGVGGWVKVNNKVAEKINPKLDAMNNKPEYRDVDVAKDPKLHKRYLDDYEKVLGESLKEAMDDFGTNASGTKKIKLELSGSGYEATWAASFEDIEHADGDIPPFRVVPKFDAKGHIIGQELKPIEEEDVLVQSHLSDAVLAHYGVKGMRWGVKRDRTPQSATAEAAPGRRPKAKGGTYQNASEDALRAARLRQTAKKSTTAALSNQELQALVTRMQLEESYDRLRKSDVQLSKGQKMAKKILTDMDPDLPAEAVTKGALKAGLTLNPKVGVAIKVGTFLARSAFGVKSNNKKKKDKK